MQNRELWSALGIVYLNTIAHPKCRCSSYFSCSICYETTRYDATVKRKRSSVRYIIISFVCSLRFVPPSFLHRIPLARLFETEQPCGGSCQNSSRPVKTMMFMPKGLLPLPPAFCFPVFLASHHVFFSFSFYHYPVRLFQIRFTRENLVPLKVPFATTHRRRYLFSCWYSVLLARSLKLFSQNSTAT